MFWKKFLKREIENNINLDQVIENDSKIFIFESKMITSFNVSSHTSFDACSHISSGLYLGSILALDDHILRNNKIKHIICLANEYVLENRSVPDYIIRHQFPVPDLPTTNIRELFDSCYFIIEEASSYGENVLVICYAGISRSSTIVISYLMKKYYMSFSESLRYVIMKRPCIMPNNGFITQLKNYEKELTSRGEDSIMEIY